MSKTKGRIFETPLALHRALEKYFTECDEEGKLYSEAGMALSLGVSPKTLDSWWNGRSCPDLQDVIQRAYLRIAEQISTDERYNSRNMVSLKIFLLKQQKFGGYQDKVEAKQDISVNVKMGSGMDESDFL